MMTYIAHITDFDHELNYTNFNRDDILAIGDLETCMNAIGENIGYDLEDMKCDSVGMDHIISDIDDGSLLGVVLFINIPD